MNHNQDGYGSSEGWSKGFDRCKSQLDFLSGRKYNGLTAEEVEGAKGLAIMQFNEWMDQQAAENGEYPEPSCQMAHLLRIFKWRCGDILKKKWKRILKEEPCEAFDSEGKLVEREFNDPNSETEANIILRMNIQTAMSKLAPEILSAINFCAQGFTDIEGATSLQIPPGTYKSRLLKGKRELKALLADVA